MKTERAHIKYVLMSRMLLILLCIILSKLNQNNGNAPFECHKNEQTFSYFIFTKKSPNVRNKGNTNIGFSSIFINP